MTDNKWINASKVSKYCIFETGHAPTQTLSYCNFWLQIRPIFFSFGLRTFHKSTTHHITFVHSIIYFIHHPWSPLPSPFLANICPLSLPKNMKILRLTVQIYLIRKIFVFFAEKPFTFTPPPSFPFPITLSTHAISFVKLLSNGDGERFRGNIWGCWSVKKCGICFPSTKTPSCWLSECTQNDLAMWLLECRVIKVKWREFPYPLK